MSSDRVQPTCPVTLLDGVTYGIDALAVLGSQVAGLLAEDLGEVAPPARERVELGDRLRELGLVHRCCVGADVALGEHLGVGGRVDCGDERSLALQLLGHAVVPVNRSAAVEAPQPEARAEIVWTRRRFEPRYLITRRVQVRRSRLRSSSRAVRSSSGILGPATPPEHNGRYAGGSETKPTRPQTSTDAILGW